MTADGAGAVGKRAEQGMSWLAEQGSTFSGPAEELKSGSSPQRAASLPWTVSCSVPSGMAAGDTISLPPSEFCIPRG